MNDELLSEPAWVSGDNERGGQEFGALIASMRHLQDCIAKTNGPPDVLLEAEAALVKALKTLEPWEVGESERPYGRRWDLPGRGQFLTPPLKIVERGEIFLVASTYLGEHYLGRNGAAHGGVVPLIFDEIMGGVANHGVTNVFRTAYLNVNFRKITPIGKHLTIDSRVTRSEGRKRFVAGSLKHEGELLADAEGLFIELRAGQP